MDWISTNILSLLNLLILIALSLFGRNWINKRNAEIKSLYSKKEIIYRMRIQKEFEIYQLLWKKLFTLKGSIQKVIENLLMHFSGISKKRTPIEPFEESEKNIQEVIQVINNNIPFYSEKVYKLANEVSEISKGINWEILLVNQIDLEKIKQFQKVAKRIYSRINEIEKAMRNEFEISDKSN